MNTIQFFQQILTWLLADPSHIVVAASVIAAITPTPDPATTAGKAYRVLDLLALNILHAKSTGVTVPQALAQVAAMMQARQATQTPPAQ